MEMNKKYARTTQSQLRWYVSFIKDHRQLLQGKNCPTAPHLIADMWLEIATNLNAMVGPTRSSDAWRESLRNWRKQLRSRARKVIAERNKTGGGQNPVSELTEFEQQALEAFGMAAVEGHSNSILGFPAENNEENIPPPYSEELTEVLPSFSAGISEDVVEISPQRCPSPFCITFCESPSPPACSASAPSSVLPPVSRSRRKTFRSEILEIVQRDMRERREEQSRLADSLSNLGNGLSSLAGAIQELISLQRQQQN